MNNITTPPIYIISLASDFERRENLKIIFPQSYNSFYFIDAVDFRGKNKSDIKEYYNCCNQESSLTPTEVACSLSHIKVLELFLKSKNEYCLVFEDDVIGKEVDLLLIKNFLSKNNFDLPLVVLGGQESMKNSKFLIGRKINNDDFWLIPRVSRIFLYRTCCYLINRKYAEHIITKQKKCLHRADDWLSFFDYNQPIFFKKIFQHPKSLEYSRIEAERILLNEPILQLIRRNLTKLILILLNFTRIFIFINKRYEKDDS